MDNKNNMTIEQLEQLVQAYFDCELDRREEEDLKAVLLFTEAHSPLIDECRLAMGLENIAVRPQAHTATAHHRFIFSKWIAAAACLAIVAVTGIVMMTTAGQLPDNSETIITVYANGKRITDSAQAHDIAMAKYNECLALAKKLENDADMRIKHANEIQQSSSDTYQRAMQIRTQSAAAEATIVERINKYTTSSN